MKNGFIFNDKKAYERERKEESKCTQRKNHRHNYESKLRLFTVCGFRKDKKVVCSMRERCNGQKRLLALQRSTTNFFSVFWLFVATCDMNELMNERNEIHLCESLKNTYCVCCAPISTHIPTVWSTLTLCGSATHITEMMMKKIYIKPK